MKLESLRALIAACSLVVMPVACTADPDAAAPATEAPAAETPAAETPTPAEQPAPAAPAAAASEAASAGCRAARPPSDGSCGRFTADVSSSDTGPVTI